jgi:hypothetical protein
MKQRRRHLIFAPLCVVLSCAFVTPLKATSFEGELVVVEDYENPIIGADHPDVRASDNRSGFETGKMVVQNGIYYLFIGEMFDKPHQDMRAALWKSEDGFEWERVRTLVHSLQYDQSPVNMKKEVWVTAAEFNEVENRWNIFYVAYTGGIRQYDDPKRTRTRDYYGRIFRAASIHLGREGIEGPYEDVDIILYPEWEEPKNLEGQQHLSVKEVESNPGIEWEGQQAVASFSPFQIEDGSWLAFIGGHWHEPRNRAWIVGLARAPELSGPWERYPEYSPSGLSSRFSENPLVTRLDDGRYLAVFDCTEEAGDPENAGLNSGNMIGYSISEDGKSWPYRKPLNLLPNQDISERMRTPLSLIPDGDNTFKIYFSYLEKGDGADFYPIGMARVQLVETTKPQASPSSGIRNRPNVVIIYGDDVGYGDVGAYGAELVPTPNIDGLAAGGLLFTDAHTSASTCTPSRYSLLTGKISPPSAEGGEGMKLSSLFRDER